MTDEISDSMFVAIMVGFAGVLISITVTVLTTMNLVKDDIVYNFTSAVTNDYRRDLAEVSKGTYMTGANLYKLIRDYESTILLFDFMETLEDSVLPSLPSTHFRFTRDCWEYEEAINLLLSQNSDCMYFVKLGFVDRGCLVSCINLAFLNEENNSYKVPRYAEGGLGHDSREEMETERDAEMQGLIEFYKMVYGR